MNSYARRQPTSAVRRTRRERTASAHARPSPWRSCRVGEGRGSGRSAPSASPLTDPTRLPESKPRVRKSSCLPSAQKFVSLDNTTARTSPTAKKPLETTPSGTAHPAWNAGFSRHPRPEGRGTPPPQPPRLTPCSLLCRRPRPILRSLTQPGLHGVVLDVEDGPRQVRVVPNSPIVIFPHPEPPGPSEDRVRFPGGRALPAPDDVGQGETVSLFDQHVHVVRHDAPRQ